MAFVINEMSPAQYRGQQTLYPALLGIGSLGEGEVPCAQDPSQPHCVPVKAVPGETFAPRFAPPPSITPKAGRGLLDRLTANKTTLLLVGGGVLVLGVVGYLAFSK